MSLGQPALGEAFLAARRQMLVATPFVHELAFANTDAGEDPVIGVNDHFFQVGIGKTGGAVRKCKGADLHFGDLRPTAVGVVNETPEYETQYFADWRAECLTHADGVARFLPGL